MADKRHEFKSPTITVTWSRTRCNHVAECLRGLPAVFQPGRRPWVDPSRADPDRIAEVVRRCPTGALHFERHDGGPPEPVPEQNVVTSGPNGPLYLRGDIELKAADGSLEVRDTRVALCRCGATKSRPWCDGSHWDTDFRDGGRLGVGDPPPAEPPPASGPLRVRFGAGGPLFLEGPFVLASRRGEEHRDLGEAALCRCGASRNKPFCDGSHTETSLREE
jgi:CDGSH-type Zn-finger protein/uncharacterized Fe-S cluster protein YjdI